MSKAYRQQQILNLVRSRPIRSQGELAMALRRAGLPATQVTLSRDLKELGLVKTPEGYAPRPAAAAPPAPASETARVLREFVRDVRPAQNLLALRTDPGAAPRVGAALDAEGWSELVASLAGDDTVLLVCADAARRAVLERRLRRLLAE
ncbi:MAG TPA: ArgR family transcriptional regulator [Terriglobales bacterium]|nr:ArgR family transcriptional regulator [Terriglobales bacterium]